MNNECDCIDFFGLTLNAYQAELYYRTEYESYVHSKDIFERYTGKNEKAKYITEYMVNSSKETSDRYLKNLKDVMLLVENMFKLMVDSNIIKEYYDLYRIRSELTKSYYEVVMKIEKNDATLIYEYDYNGSIDLEKLFKVQDDISAIEIKKLLNENNLFEYEKKFIDKKIEKINEKIDSKFGSFIERAEELAVVV